jgi:hypothetical protein
MSDKNLDVARCRGPGKGRVHRYGLSVSRETCCEAAHAGLRTGLPCPSSIAHCVPIFPSDMELDLTREEVLALRDALVDAVAESRYPLSPATRALKAILRKMGVGVQATPERTRPRTQATLDL